MVIKEEIPNVIDILEKAKKAIDENDVILLKELGNRTIHTASTAQDTDSILLAVIMYTLSKLIERPEHKDKAIKNFCSVCSISFDKAIENLKKGKQKEFVASLTGYKNISEEERELSETEQVKVRIKTALEMFG